MQPDVLPARFESLRLTFSHMLDELLWEWLSSVSRCCDLIVQARLLVVRRAKMRLEEILELLRGADHQLEVVLVLGE